MPIINMVYKKKQGRLPAEYQEVEYIESSWWQVIETDVTYMLHPFTLEVKYMKQNTDASDQTLVWQRQIWKYVNIYNNYYENLWSNSASWTASWDNNIHTVITDSSAWLYKDWTLIVSGTYTTWKSSSYPLLIFAFSENDASNAKRFFKWRIYEVKINNASLARHYIPCYRKSDWVIWMYELITGQFKTNAGSWTFTKWPDVSIDYSMIKYIDMLLIWWWGWAWYNCNQWGWWGWAWWYIENNCYPILQWSYPITIWAWWCMHCNWWNSTFDKFFAYWGWAWANGASVEQWARWWSWWWWNSSYDNAYCGQWNRWGWWYYNRPQVASGWGGWAWSPWCDATTSQAPSWWNWKCSCISWSCVWYAWWWNWKDCCCNRYWNGWCWWRWCWWWWGETWMQEEWKSWVFIARYPTACWYNITWWTKYTCWGYTIHCFTSNWTLTVW